MYCNTKSPEWENWYQTFDQSYFENAKLANQDETLYVQTRYVCLYATDEQKIGLRRVQDNHKALNIAFSSKNTEELNTVPDTPLYPFKKRIGNPNIQFLPLDESQVQVEYIKINSTSLDNTAPVEDAAERSGRMQGVLNIYIGNSSMGILGQAELGSNIAFSSYRAVGGPNAPGMLTEYALGKTLIHEVGHVFGLAHTFSDDQCDDRKVYADVPEQIRPNFNAEIFTKADGTTEGRGCNRDNDRTEGTNSSCLEIQTNQGTASNEMFMSYMDYAVDRYSIMFSENQALLMRSWLTSDANVYIDLKSADYVADWGETDIEKDGNKETSSLSTAQIYGIVIGIVLGIVFMTYIGYKIYNKKKMDIPKKSRKIRSKFY